MPLPTLPAQNPSAPNELTEQGANNPAVPNELTEQAVGNPAAPNELTELGAQGPAAPNELTELAVGTPAIPNNLTEQAAQNPAIPNELTELAAATMGAPTELSFEPTTNLIRWSEEMDRSAIWVGADRTIIANALAAPDGTTTAERFEASTTGTNAPDLRQVVTGLTIGETYTYSIYARRSSYNWMQIRFGGGQVTGDPRANFDLLDGVLGSVDPEMEAYITRAPEAVGEFYYRCSVTFVAASTSLTIYNALILSGSDARGASNSFIDGNGIYVWGAQLEQGRLTSYLRTEDAAATEGQILPPTELTEQVAGSMGVPNELTELAAGSMSPPSELTELAVATMPRTLEPVFSFDFANGLFAINGEETTIAESLTYSRNDTATFWDRRLNERGEWETFLNTDYVGSVTNLLTYSEDFTDPDWTAVDAVVTSNNNVTFEGRQTFRIESDGTGSFPAVDQNPTTVAGFVTFTAVVKAGTDDNVYLRIAGTGIGGGAETSCTAVFNLTSGLAESDAAFGGFNSPVLESVYLGDGWYEISISVETTTTTSTSVRPEFNSTAVSDFYIARAQVTQSNKKLPYVQTTSVTASQTFTESPRIEVDPVTAEVLGYLSEIQATNRVANSEDSSNWGSQNVTVTPNYDRAPDGTMSATLMTDDATSGTHHIFDTISGGALNTQYTVSAYIKSIDLRYAWVYGQASLFANRAQALFDLETGEVVSGSGASFGNYTFNDARIVDCGNGWYRCCVTFTSSNTATEEFNTVSVCGDINTDASTTYVGTSQSFLVWGLQAEDSPYATSYIPNSSGGTTTRVRDELNGDGSLVPTVLEKQTYFVEAKVNFDNVFNGANPKTFWGTDDDPRYFRINTGNNLEVRHGSGAATDNLSAFDTTEMTKYAGVINDNITTYRNGVQLGFQSSLSGLDNTVNDLFGIGHAAHTTTQNCDGHVRKVELYDTNLTPYEVTLL